MAEDLNKGKGSPSDDDQSGNDKSGEEELNLDIKETKDGKVRMPKEQLDQLLEDRKNYKKGLLSKKEELKALKKQDQDEDEGDGEYVTKSEFFKSIEQKAKAKARKNEEFEKNEDDIMAYYIARRGKSTVEGQLADLKDAYVLWKENEKQEEEGEDKESKSKLAVEKGKPSGGPETKGKKKKKKRILQKPTPPQEWYGEEEE